MQLFYGVPEDIEIYGANAHKTFTKTRVGCRGIVIKDFRMLISHEVLSLIHI